MAIVQTQAQLRVMANKVGIHPERSDQIKTAGATATTTAHLRAVLHSMGYYSEKADHLVAAGVTFA